MAGAWGDTGCMADFPVTAHDVVEFVTGAFLAVGTDSDIDVAFDEAAAASLTDYGQLNADATLAGVLPSQITVIGAEPSSRDLAIAAAVRYLDGGGDVEPGVAYAFAYAASRGFTRRRVTVRLTDTDLPIASEGALVVVPDELARAIEGALGEDGPLGEDEQIESVVVRMLRDRFKPTVTPYRGKSVRSYVGMVGSNIVTEGFKTAGEARRELVARMRSGELGENAEVVALIRREGDVPFLAIERTHVSRRSTLRVTLVRPKSADTAGGRAASKVAGWVFAGVAHEPVVSGVAGDSRGDGDGYINEPIEDPRSV